MIGEDARRGGEDEGGDNDGRVDKEYNEATDSHDDTLKRRQKLAIGSMLGAGYDINPAASAAAAQGSPGGEAGHRMALLRELKELLLLPNHFQKHGFPHQIVQVVGLHKQIFLVILNRF